MDLKEKLTESVELVKGKAETTFASVKDVVIEQAEKWHGATKKDYNVKIVIDKQGVQHVLQENRNTKQTIKWRSKGY